MTWNYKSHGNWNRKEKLRVTYVCSIYYFLPLHLLYGGRRMVSYVLLFLFLFLIQYISIWNISIFD